MDTHNALKSTTTPSDIIKTSEIIFSLNIYVQPYNMISSFIAQLMLVIIPFCITLIQYSLYSYADRHFLSLISCARKSSVKSDSEFYSSRNILSEMVVYLLSKYCCLSIRLYKWKIEVQAQLPPKWAVIEDWLA